MIIIIKLINYEKIAQEYKKKNKKKNKKILINFEKSCLFWCKLFLPVDNKINLNLSIILLLKKKFSEKNLFDKIYLYVNY